jgi:uncharacterized coiled-coil protein SlyX
MDCEFCNKSFSTKYLLTQHQKKTKYCLDLQGSNSVFQCKFCNKQLSTKDRLILHTNSCKENNEKENIIKKEYEEKIKIIEKEYDDKLKIVEKVLQEKNEYITKLETKLEKIEAKLDSKLEKLESAVTTIAIESKTALSTPSTTTNNTTNITVTQTNNNVLNLSKEHVNKVLKDHLDYDVVYAGQAGFAKFVVDKMLKGPDGKLTYKCVDPSRQMFEFIDESGETVRDMRAEKLIQSLLDGDAIKIGLDAAAKGWNTEDRQLNNDRTATFGPRVNEYTELNRNNNVFRTKVSSLTT